MAAKDQPHPWLQPLHRRVALVLVCLVWLGFESWAGVGELWFWMALAMTGWGLWDFFLSGKYHKLAA